MDEKFLKILLKNHLPLGFAPIVAIQELFDTFAICSHGLTAVAMNTAIADIRMMFMTFHMMRQ